MQTWADLDTGCRERCSPHIKQIIVAQGLVHEIFWKEVRVYFQGCCHL